MLTRILGNGLLLPAITIDVDLAAQILSTMPVIYWPGDDAEAPATDTVGDRHQTNTSGTVAFDQAGATVEAGSSIGLGTDAGASGGIWWLGDDVGDNIFEADSDWTMMFMFRLRATGSGRTLISLSGDLANANRIVVVYNGNTISGPLRMNIIDQGGTTRFNGDLTDAGTVLRDGSTWYHATIRSNGTSRVVRTRLNGTDYSSGSHPVGGMTWQTWMFMLGANKGSGGAIGVDGRQFMQHCAVWDRELTDEEIDDIYGKTGL